MHFKKLIAFFLLLPLTLTAAEDSEQATLWSKDDLDRYKTMLAEQVGDNHSAVADRIIDYDDYFAAMVYREPGSALFEAHAEWVDVYMVSDGQGILTVGGTLADVREVSPGEFRGSAIVGGTDLLISEGDIVHIPVNSPHTVAVAEGETITYFILKVKDSGN